MNTAQIKRTIVLCMLVMAGMVSRSQEVIPLYTGLPPGNLPVADSETATKSVTGRFIVKNVSKPTLTVFLPEKPDASGTSVLICPGGGYLNLSIEDGGYDVAKQLNNAGITAFVLKYRTWKENTFSSYRDIPMSDLKRAMQIIHQHAVQWKIDPSRIGYLGLSAGGHLTAMAANTDTMPKPAFTILIYPVISFMDSLTSRTSKTRGTLIGDHPSPAEKIERSPELHVTSKTPPAFIVQAEDDSTSLVGNSLVYHKALVNNRVPCQLLIYQKGGHGFALYNKAQDEYWMPAAIKWLALNKFYNGLVPTR